MSGSIQKEEDSLFFLLQQQQPATTKSIYLKLKKNIKRKKHTNTHIKMKEKL